MISLVYKTVSTIASQSVIPGLVTSPGNLLDIRYVRDHAKHTKSEPIF